MSRTIILSLYFAACFTQSGTYGLTFLLPDLFQIFGANEKDVGLMLGITTLATLIAVYFAGQLLVYSWFSQASCLGLVGDCFIVSHPWC